MTQYVRALGWLALYVLLIVTPVIVAVVTDPITTRRPVFIEFSVGVGLLAFSLIVVQFALVSHVKVSSRPFGTDALAQFHGYMGFLALAFVLLHPALLSVEGLPLTAWLPFGGSPATVSGALALWGIVALVLSTILRARLGLSYEAWRVTHMSLSVVVVVAVAVHIAAVNRYSSNAALRAVLVAYILMFGSALILYRIVRPLRMRSRAWTVTRNAAVGAGTHHLTVQPAHHSGFAFDPGQFAWLTTGRSPFSLQQHPLSIASSAERPADGSIEFAIRELGDWSRTFVPNLTPGDRVWVDGAFGAFTTERKAAQGFVMIAGGAGIAPMRSMLLTMRDRDDRRHVLLLYAAHDLTRMPFRDELEALRRVMALDIVDVLEAPPPDWNGARGYVTADLLKRYLPAQFRRYHFFVCGPPAMMNAVEAALLADGVPAASIDSERFNLV